MKLPESSRVAVTIRMPASLHERVKAIAAKRNISINDLLLIWTESQTSPGADVVIGKAHS